MSFRRRMPKWQRIAQRKQWNAEAKLHRSGPMARLATLENHNVEALADFCALSSLVKRIHMEAELAAHSAGHSIVEPQLTIERLPALLTFHPVHILTGETATHITVLYSNNNNNHVFGRSDPGCLLLSYYNHCNWLLWMSLSHLSEHVREGRGLSETGALCTSRSCLMPDALGLSTTGASAAAAVWKRVLPY